MNHAFPNPQRRIVSCLLLSAVLSIASFARADDEPGWNLEVDKPAASTATVHINPKLKIDGPRDTKMCVMNDGSRPMLLAWFDGIKVRDLAGNVDRGTIPAKIEFSGEPVVSPDGKWVAVRRGKVESPPYLIEVYDSRMARLVMSATIPNGYAVPMGFTDADHLAVAVNKGSGSESTGALQVYEVGTKAVTDAQPQITYAAGSAVNVMRASPTGKYLALVLESGQIDIVESKTGNAVANWTGTEQQVAKDCSFSPDGTELALLAGRDYNPASVPVLDAATGKLKLTLGARSMQYDRNLRVQSAPLVQWFPDGKALMVGYETILDRHTGQQLPNLDSASNGSYYQTLRWVIADDMVLTFRPWGGQYKHEAELTAEPYKRTAIKTVAVDGDSKGSAGPAAAHDIYRYPRSPDNAGFPDGVPRVEFRSSLGYFDPDAAAPVSSDVKLRDIVPLRPSVSGIENIIAFSPESTQVIVQYAAVNVVVQPQPQYQQQYQQRNNFQQFQQRQPPPAPPVKPMPVAFERWDLATGEMISRLECNPPFELLDVSPDGAFILLKIATPQGAEDYVEVHATSGKGNPVAQWVPHQGDNNAGKVMWGGFVDNTHLVTCGGGNVMTGWELTDTNPKATWVANAQVSNSTWPAFSAHRKMLAWTSYGMVYVIDPLTGGCLKCFSQPVENVVQPQPGLRVATYQIPDRLYGAPSFSPDGKSLAVYLNSLDYGVVSLVDLEQKRPIRTFFVPALEPGKGGGGRRRGNLPPLWLGGPNVLLGGVILADLGREVPFWSLEFEALSPTTWNVPEPAMVTGRYVYSFEADPNKRPGGKRIYSLTSVDLPAEDMILKSESLTKENIPAVRAGATVSLVFKGDGADAMAPIVKQAVTDAGYKIGEGQSVVVTTTLNTYSAYNGTSYSSSDSSGVRIVGGHVSTLGGGTVVAQQLTAKQNNISVAITADGRSCWKRSTSTEMVGQGRGNRSGSAYYPPNVPGGQNLPRDRVEVNTPSAAADTDYAKILADQTTQATRGMLASFPTILANSMQLNSSRLPHVPVGWGGAQVRTAVAASVEKEKACLAALNKIVPRIADLRIAAAAVAASVKGDDPQAYLLRISELERLRAALLPVDYVVGLLDPETEAYRQLIENAYSASTLFTLATSNLTRGVAREGAASHFHAISLYYVAIPADADFLQSRLEELRRKYP